MSTDESLGQNKNEAIDAEWIKIKSQKRKLSKLKKRLHNESEQLSEDKKVHDYTVEFKSQAYNAFYQSAMEKDKSLLTISVAGVGFLITLAQQNEGSHTSLFNWLLILGCMSFLACIFVVLAIFKINKDYLVSIVTDDHEGGTLKNKHLTTLDTLASALFYSGLIHASTLGLITLKILQ